MIKKKEKKNQTVLHLQRDKPDGSTGGSVVKILRGVVRGQRQRNFTYFLLTYDFFV